MCSVIRCESWCRNVQRFKLPQDPEKRLKWVQFIAEVNGQRFKESCWTDITVCSQHFTKDCFENRNPTSLVQLKPGAVPTLCVSFEPNEAHWCNTEDTKSEETTYTTDVSSECDIPKTCDSPISCHENSSTSMAAQESGVPCSTDPGDVCDYTQMLQRVTNIDTIRKKAALLQMKGKYVVNEECLMQLFSSKCLSCGGTLKTTKVIHEVLIILNHQCLQCHDTKQWTSQVKTSLPKAVRQHLTGATDVTPQFPQEESYSGGKTDSSEDCGLKSDEEWNPEEELLLAEDSQKDTDEDTEDDNDGVDDLSLLSPIHSRLCTDCGRFFSKWKHHTCEHKIKPYSCNICGKRCVSQNALSTHSRIHEDDYEYRCKYCHTTFRTKADKMTHEQTHFTEGRPYKCTDCPETFASIKERRAHLEVHRGPKQLKCNICGIEFMQPLSLKRHIVVHTGVKAYKCSLCQRGFNQPGHLKSHMRLHTGERPYKCQYCDKCFNHNVSLKTHVQRYHTNNSGRAPNKCKTVICTVEGWERHKEDAQKKMHHPKSKKRSTGRPKGRPKRNASDILVLG